MEGTNRRRSDGIQLVQPRRSSVASFDLAALSFILITAGAAALHPPLRITALALIAVSSTLALLWMRQIQRSSDGHQPIAGIERLHAEVDRARRLDFSFAVMGLPRVALKRSNDRLRAEAAIRTVIRGTDTVFRHRRRVFIILPRCTKADQSKARGRFVALLPEMRDLIEACSFAEFPAEAVTADGLLDACAYYEPLSEAQ